MSAHPAFWITCGGLLAACISAIAGWALRDFSRHDLEDLCRRRNRLERLGEILRSHERVAAAMDCLFIVAVVITVAATVAWSWHRAQPQTPIAATALVAGGVVSAALLLVFALWLPRAIVRLWAAAFLYATWRFWLGLASLLRPLTYGGRFFDTLLHRLAGRTPEESNEESFEDEIRTIVTEGHREGLLEEDAREMIEGVIELGDADVSQIMTPRTDMVCMPVNLTWHEALDFVIKAGHSRIPVYDKTRDDIVGLLYSKDLLPELARGRASDERPLREILRKPNFVPETKPLDAVLQEFQRTRTHMAVVLDEFGGVAGLVTIEDVLEEIVGEIVDEHDPDLVEGIRQLDERTSEVLGRVHVDEINERLGLEITEEGDYDTIGGFVFSELGRIPRVGEQLIHNDIRITVLEATPRRIDRVRIERLDEGAVRQELA